MFRAMSEFRACRLAPRHLIGIGRPRKLGLGHARHRIRTWVFESLESRAILSTIAVLSTGDTGPGTLRAAIEQANTDAAQDTITFAPSVTGTITLSTALPDLSAGMNIVGPGTSILTVARSGAGGTPYFRIFTVSAGVQVAISGLTITGGNATAFGGGIENSGTLSIVNAVISDNVAGTLQVDYVSSAGNGGGIDNSGTLSITDSTISGNSAYGGLNGLPGLGETPGQGGGINNTGNMMVTDSTVNGNSASLGGGIDNFGALAVVCSTVSGNTAVGYRGTYKGEGIPQGGGIDNSGTLSVTYSTISGNIAVEGGGIENSDKVSIVDTIVAGNIRDSVNGDANDIGGDVTGSNNLIGPGGSGGLIGGQDGNIVLTSLTGLGLSALGNYGGPTQTMALLPGSPAIDAGIAVSGVTTDQRGITRPQGVAPDIGAFEVLATATLDLSGAMVTMPLGGTNTITAMVTGPGGIPLVGIPVTFRLLAGPNSGATVVTNPANGRTGVNGQVEFVYIGAGGAGTDTISVTALLADGVTIAAPLTTTRWVNPPTVVNLQRHGVHLQPTAIVVTFSEPMDPTQADTLANYSLVSAGPGHRLGTRDDRPILIRSVQYDTVTNTVTLRPFRRLPLRGTYLLTIEGIPTTGLRGTNGLYLDGAGTGQEGTNYVATVDRKSLVLLPIRHHGGTPTTVFSGREHR